MRTKYLILIVALQLSLNIYAIIYVGHALALDPCATAAPVTPSAIAKTPTPAAPTFAFTGTVTRAPEANNLVVYAMIKSKAGQPLEGYKLKFIQNGNAVPVQNLSTPYVWGLTRPPTIIGGNSIERDGKPYNYKAAFDVLSVGAWFSPAGQWTLTLLDNDGKPVSAESAFTVADKDGYMEIYAEFVQN